MRFIRQLLIVLQLNDDVNYCPHCGLDPCGNLTDECSG